MTASQLLPSYRKLGLKPLVHEAVQWQIERSGAMFLEVWNESPHERGRDRFHEVGGLFGSTAEAVILAAAAEVEIALLRSAIQAGHLPREYGMCQRFYADAICNTIVSVTNRMVNIAFRVAMIHPDYPWSTPLKNRAIRTAFQPFSDSRSEWVDLAMEGPLGEIARASHEPSLVRLHGSVARLMRHSAWVAVNAHRAEAHHRWRYESPYVAGLNKRSAWVVEEGFVSIEGPEHDYTDADRIVEEVCATAHEGLLRLKRAMFEFRRAFQDSVSVVSGGSVRYVKDPNVGQTRTATLAGAEDEEPPLP